MPVPLDKKYFFIFDGRENIQEKRNPILPDPMAPMKSAKTESAPMQSPPNAAAVGMYLFSSWIMDVSRCPRMTICCSRNCLATCK